MPGKKSSLLMGLPAKSGTFVSDPTKALGFGQSRALSVLLPAIFSLPHQTFTHVLPAPQCLFPPPWNWGGWHNAWHSPPHTGSSSSGVGLHQLTERFQGHGEDGWRRGGREEDSTIRIALLIINYYYLSLLCFQPFFYNILYFLAIIW